MFGSANARPDGPLPMGRLLEAYEQPPESMTDWEHPATRAQAGLPAPAFSFTSHLSVPGTRGNGRSTLAARRTTTHREEDVPSTERYGGRGLRVVVIPHLIGRHAHVAARLETPPALPAPTGIDYVA